MGYSVHGEKCAFFSFLPLSTGGITVLSYLNVAIRHLDPLLLKVSQGKLKFQHTSSSLSDPHEKRQGLLNAEHIKEESCLKTPASNFSGLYWPSGLPPLSGLHWAGGWNEMLPSNPNHSMVLRKYSSYGSI